MPTKRKLQQLFVLGALFVGMLSARLPCLAQVKAGEAQQYASPPAANGSVTVVVSDAAGAVVSGAQVALSKAGGPQVKGTTDASGQVKVFGISPGPYDVSAEQAGFKTVEQRVMVAPGAAVTVKLTLLPGSTGAASAAGGTPTLAGQPPSHTPLSDRSAGKVEHTGATTASFTRDAKQELLDLENRWLHAEDDPQVQEEILAPDFLHVLPGGIITKEEQISYLRNHQSQGPAVPKHFEDLHVRIYGTVGIVTGAVVRGEGEEAHRTLFTDVFAYRDGKWRAVSAQELHPDRP